MASAMGGHVAESLVFGEVTTGASNDLQKATEMARRMVCQYGMSEQLGAVALAPDISRTVCAIVAPGTRRGLGAYAPGCL